MSEEAARDSSANHGWTHRRASSGQHGEGGHSLIETAHHVEDLVSAGLGTAKREFGKLPLVGKITWFIHTYVYKPIVLKDSNMSTDEDVNMFLKGFHNHHNPAASSNQVRSGSARNTPRVGHEEGMAVCTNAQHARGSDLGSR